MAAETVMEEMVVQAAVAMETLVQEVQQLLDKDIMEVSVQEHEVEAAVAALEEAL